MRKAAVDKKIKWLKKYIGFEIIRIERTDTGDSSYMRDPILLLGFTADGRIRCKHTTKIKLFGDEERVLPSSFTDMNWITYKNALRSQGNKMNKWRGKNIIRINPTIKYSKSFMEDPVVLISASSYHMVVLYNNKPMVLEREYTKFNDWILEWYENI